MLGTGQIPCVLQQDNDSNPHPKAQKEEGNGTKGKRTVKLLPAHNTIETLWKKLKSAVS